MTLIGDAADWLFGELNEHDGVQVTIARSGESSITVTAVRGRTAYDQEGVDGDNPVSLRRRIRDYQIDAADYDFGSGPVEPARGDLITDGTDTFRVLPDPGGHLFEYMDPGRTRFRVHTKETH